MKIFLFWGREIDLGNLSGWKRKWKNGLYSPSSSLPSLQSSLNFVSRHFSFPLKISSIFCFPLTPPHLPSDVFPAIFPPHLPLIFFPHIFSLTPLPPSSLKFVSRHFLFPPQPFFSDSLPPLNSFFFQPFAYLILFPCFLLTPFPRLILTPYFSFFSFLPPYRNLPHFPILFPAIPLPILPHSLSLSQLFVIFFCPPPRTLSPSAPGLLSPPPY